MTEFTHDSFNGRLKCRLWCDEAEDEVIAGGEVIEMTRVEKDVVIAEEVDSEIFLRDRSGGGRGVAKGGVPASFSVEELNVGVRAELRFEVGEIFFDTGEELGAEGLPLSKESGEGGLGGGAEGEISVGDDFEAIKGGADLRGRTGNG